MKCYDSRISLVGHSDFTSAINASKSIAPTCHIDTKADGTANNGISGITSISINLRVCWIGRISFIRRDIASATAICGKKL